MPSPTPRRHGWRVAAAQPADPRHVRAMAALCLASAALQVPPLVLGSSEVPAARRVLAIVVGLAAAAGYDLLRHRFRVWTLHAAMVLGAGWGLLGVALAQRPARVGALLATILWTAVLVGVVARPPAARLYAAAFAAAPFAVLLPKGRPGDLELAIPFAASYAIVILTLNRLVEQQRRDARTDPLTGVRNRTGLAEDGARAVDVARRTGVPLVVAMIDMDGFKAVNDSEGHAVGDALLRETTSSWAAALRPGDVVGRAGGDEFVLVLPGTSPAAAEDLLQQLREASPTPFTSAVAELRPGDALEDLIKRADLALLTAKAARRG